MKKNMNYLRSLLIRSLALALVVFSLSTVSAHAGFVMGKVCRVDYQAGLQQNQMNLIRIFVSPSRVCAEEGTDYRAAEFWGAGSGIGNPNLLFPDAKMAIVENKATDAMGRGYICQINTTDNEPVLAYSINCWPPYVKQ